MKAAARGGKGIANQAPNHAFRSSKQRASPLLAVNLIDAAPKRARIDQQAGLFSFFSAAS